MRTILYLLLLLLLPKYGISQFECDRYYIFDLRDSTINSSNVVVFKMYTDTNTTNLGTYTSLCFVDQNSDTLNQFPFFAYELPIVNTPYDTMEYVLYYDNGFTNFPANFDGILLATVPYCEIPYDHTSISTPIEKIENPVIQIFPNPSAERVRILNKPGIKITSIKLYDSIGRLIRVESFNFDEINISNLESGIYLIKVYSNDKEIAREKLIKS